MLMKPFVATILFSQFLTAQTTTTVVLLGTGMPRPSMTASGPATAVVVAQGKAGTASADQRVFLVDAGPGVERQLSGANLTISGPEAVFITHLHSDHTLGYPDLIFTSWVMGRAKPLKVFGPPGLQNMTEHILAAYAEDIDNRIKGLRLIPGGYKVDAHEIKAPDGRREKEMWRVVYDSAGVRVSLMPVPHEEWEFSYAYRFDTPDRSVVISGDTRYSEELAVAAKGVDVLVHEVYPEKRVKPENRPGGEHWPEYLREAHTSDVELGKLASIAQPKLLILTHMIRMGGSDEELLKGVQEGGFTGPAVVGRDLERY